MLTRGVAVSAVAAGALLLPGFAMNHGDDGTVAARYKGVVAEAASAAPRDAPSTGSRSELPVGAGGDGAPAPAQWRHIRLPETHAPDAPFRRRHARAEQT